jgi:hypothetical protein
MAERYFLQRADDCAALARAESDSDMRQMLLELAHDYRERARLAMTPYRAH